MQNLINVEQNVNIYVHAINLLGKKTILFIHGWPLSHRAYEYEFNQLPKLGYQCIGIDTRRFGYSDNPWKVNN